MNESLRQRKFWEDGHRLGEIVLLAALYLVTAFGGIQLASLNNFVTPIWPAAGISVFAVYRLGFSGAILTFLCVLLLDLVTGANLPVAMAIAAGNTSEALTITILFHRWLQRPKDQKNAFQEFIARNFITALGCLISAIIGTLALSLGNTITLADLPRNTLTWFTGNYLGVLLVFPLLNSLWSIPWHHFPETLRQSFTTPRITPSHLASLTTLLAPATLYLVLAPQYYGDSAIILGLLLVPLLARRTPAVFLWLSLLALASVIIGSAIWEDLHHPEIDRNSRLLLIQVRIFACFLWYSIIRLLQREDMLQQSRWPLVIGWGLAAIVMFLVESYQRTQNQEMGRYTQETVTPFLLLSLTLLVLFLSTYISMIEVIRQKAQNLANAMSAALDAERARSQHAAKMHALGEMATGVAHEINNPLAIISGMTDHIKRQLRKDPTATDQIRQSVDRIQETAFRIARIVKGLQSFSHHAEGESPASLSLRMLVSETIDFAQMRLEAGDITITTVIDNDGSFLGKPIQLSQVLLNLINNAIDATEGQPKRWIHVMARIVDNHAVIAVTDSGPRIPKLIADKMMQPFFTTKTPGKGTGLGLNISQGIMASMEGRLYYDAQTTHTRFVMEFPLQQDTARVSTSS